MKILVLNCGSSSLKYQLINMETDEVMASGKYERIGEKEAFITHKVNGQKIVIEHTAMNHEEAVDFTLKQLVNPEYKVIDSLDEINAIGHRLVHGGEKISESVVIDDNVVNVLKECIDLAPLHNPAGIIGIEACKKVMPGKPMVGVFDTAFHQTMPKERYLYPINYEYYEKYGIRKYGFHGTSHMYVSNRLAEIENKDINHIFEPLYKADVSRNDTNSTGMGLAIVRNILDLHNYTCKVVQDEEVHFIIEMNR